MTTTPRNTRNLPSDSDASDAAYTLRPQPHQTGQETDSLGLDLENAGWRRGCCSFHSAVQIFHEMIVILELHPEQPERGTHPPSQSLKLGLQHHRLMAAVPDGIRTHNPERCRSHSPPSCKPSRHRRSFLLSRQHNSSLLIPRA